MKMWQSLISNILFFIGWVTAMFFFMFLFGSNEPYWVGLLICILICTICFGSIWLLEKIRRKKLSPEEKNAEDEENKRIEKSIEKATYMYGNNSYNSWILHQAKENHSNEINNIIYKEIDEMIEKAPDVDTQIMLLKEKNKMLQEDLKKVK